MNNLDTYMQLCFSNVELTYQILFHLDPLAQTKAARVCKSWNQITYNPTLLTFKQTLHGRIQELIEKLPFIFIANNYLELVDRVSSWANDAQVQVLFQGLGKCQTKEEANTLFNNIIKPLSEACGHRVLQQMQPDIVSNLSLAQYQRLIDQVIPRKEEDITQQKHIVLYDDANEDNGWDIIGELEEDVQSATEEEAATKQHILQEIDILNQCFQKQIRTGDIEGAHQSIMVLEQIKGGIDQETCSWRVGLALEICRQQGFIAASKYLQLVDQARFDIQETLLTCFKIHLKNDKKCLPSPEANLQLLQDFSKNMLAKETALACLDATVKMFLKQPKDFDKTLAWACHPEGSSDIRYHRIQACVKCLHVWSSLPLESMKNLTRAIKALSLNSVPKNDIYYQFVLQLIKNKHFSQEHEKLILNIFHKGIDDTSIKVNLIKKLVDSHININSVALIKNMIVIGLTNHPQHDFWLMNCVNWYFNQQNFKEADTIISKMKNSSSRLFMQAHAITVLLQQGCIDQAIDQSYQQMDNLFIRTPLTKHITCLGLQEKYDEALRFMARIPKHYHRYAEAIYCQVALPLTEIEIQNMELLCKIEKLSVHQMDEIQTAVEGIQQLSYRDAAQFKVMQKLLASNIEAAMGYASQHLDSPLIGTAIIVHLEKLGNARKYKEAHSIIHQMPPEHEKGRAILLIEYMMNRDRDLEMPRPAD